MKIEIKFFKMHGCGNDFVIIDNRYDNIEFTKNNLIKLADRRFGIGCDQVILINHDNDYDCFMRIYNNDGSESGNCGNAIRCIAKILYDHHPVKIRTITSLVEVHSIDDEFNVYMSPPKFAWCDIPLKYELNTSKIELMDMVGFAVNIGNPHIVFFVDDLDLIDVCKLGSLIENNELFPEKINVNFAQIVSRGTIQLKTWERGAGYTLACGTGSCATAIAAISQKSTDEFVIVKSVGGDLKIKWDGSNLQMQGDANLVYSGKIIL